MKENKETLKKKKKKKKFYKKDLKQTMKRWKKLDMQK